MQIMQIMQIMQNVYRASWFYLSGHSNVRSKFVKYHFFILFSLFLFVLLLL